MENMNALQKGNSLLMFSCSGPFYYQFIKIACLSRVPVSWNLLFT